MEKQTEDRRTRRLARRSLLIVVLALLPGLAVIDLQGIALGQAGAPAIAFLNPSNFASSGTERDIFVSDKIPMDPRTGDASYRLSAWVANGPGDPGVEFEVLNASGVVVDTIDGDIQLGTDTFEADWNIPDLIPEGPYVIRATLFDISENAAIAQASIDVTYDRNAERVEIEYPNNRGLPLWPGGGSFGSYAPVRRALPAEGESAARIAPHSNVDLLQTSRTAGPEGWGTGPSRIRAFYTISPPGSVPEWKVCGTEGGSGSAGGASNGVRCLLESEADQTQVTAIAAVANGRSGSNFATFQEANNEAGDATRVLQPYVQVPTNWRFTQGNGQTVETLGTEYNCFFAQDVIEGRLSDQLDREIVGYNVDVHAQGPNDRLTFDQGILNDASAKPPDRGNHPEEGAFDCFNDNDESWLAPQGEHQVFNGPDIKHIEDDVDSGDDGRWGFNLMVRPASTVSDESFTTFFTFWIDEAPDGCMTNDDRYNDGELVLFGSIGWSHAPLDPRPVEPLPILPCTPPTTAPTTSPSPSPTMTSSPPPPSGERDVALQANRTLIRQGQKVTLHAAIAAEEESCASLQEIQLQQKRRRTEWRTVSIKATDEDGRARFVRRPRRTTNYRALTPREGFCERAVSPREKVRVPR